MTISEYDVQALEGAASFFEEIATGANPAPLAFAQAIRRVLAPAPAAPSQGVEPVAWWVIETLPSGATRWQCVEHEQQAREIARQCEHPAVVRPLYATPPAGAVTAQGDGVREALERIAEATVNSTNAWSAQEAFAWCAAVAETALAQPQAAQVTEAARDVLAERHRQVSAEGWTTEHDDTHSKGEMGKAAGVYALAASSHDYRWVLRGSPVNDYLAATFEMWPWDWSWFKPSDRRRDLVKAGALILAEIERLDRAALNGAAP